MTTPATEAPKDLVGFLDFYLVAKSPFQIPAGGKDWIVKFGLEQEFKRSGELSSKTPFDLLNSCCISHGARRVSSYFTPIAECVTCKDNTFPQLLLLVEFAHDAADRIYKAIVESAAGMPALKPTYAIDSPACATY
ncbi:MAG: hypothetical protein EXQ55_05075 [Acidobacteria bacterium]|nr:hypothetical protein [Acidobacteriota bacterium]